MTTATRSRTIAQKFAFAFGTVYVGIAVAGAFVADRFTGGSIDDKLILFPVNHLHNIVHFGFGAVWVSASKSDVVAKAVNLMIGITYLLVAAVGFTGVDFMHTFLNVHGPGSADNFLHLISGVAGVYFGSAGASMASISGTDGR